MHTFIYVSAVVPKKIVKIFKMSYLTMCINYSFRAKFPPQLIEIYGQLFEYVLFYTLTWMPKLFHDTVNIICLQTLS